MTSRRYMGEVRTMAAPTKLWVRPKVSIAINQEPAITKPPKVTQPARFEFGTRAIKRSPNNCAPSSILGGDMA